MKGLLVLLVLALAFAGVIFWYTQKQMEKMPDEYIAIAFGQPTDDQIKMDVAISIAMPRREYPRFDPITGAVYWQEWVDEHFDLRDGAGNKVMFQRQSMSQLMSDQEVGGSPEFFLTGMIKKNANYTFVYIPVLALGEQFRYEFTAPAEDTNMERVRCRLVENAAP